LIITLNSAINFADETYARAAAMSKHFSDCNALQVLVVDAELNAIVVKGAIPGKAGNTVEILPAKVVGKNC